MDKERDILKKLLLKEELEVISQLKDKLLSQEQFTQEVSQVLVGAIKRVKDQNQFKRALSSPINEGVNRAFTENKQTIIDSLLPIMGQLIRKTVANSIKHFVADINRTLEVAFSAKYLKWRWQSFRTGKSFAEIVFQKTIKYQVNELFLINKENGLLIEHVGFDDMLKDNDAISGMLTAIQDFIGDSLQTPDSGLLSAEIDDNLILISKGPTAYLASVIKGSPTERLKEKFQKTIENIHAEFSEYLDQEQHYRNIPDLKEYLRGNLVVKNISKNGKSVNVLPWILGLLLIVCGLIYYAYTRQQQFNQVEKQLDSISGLYVQSIKRKGSGFEVVGLKDPLSNTSALKDLNVMLKTKPYLSLDKKIIDRRVKKILLKYPNIKTQFNKTILSISGLLNIQQKEKLLNDLNKVVGLEQISDNIDIDKTQEINDFLQVTLPKNTSFTLNNNIAILTGKTTFNQKAKLKSKINKKFPQLHIEDGLLKIIDTTTKLKKIINNTVINVPKLNSNSIEELEKIKLVIKSSQTLHKRSSKIHLSIIGYSDCKGKNSDSYSLNRAQSIKQYFIERGFDTQFISTTINPCKTFKNQENKSILNVKFNLSEKNMVNK